MLWPARLKIVFTLLMSDSVVSLLTAIFIATVLSLGWIGCALLFCNEALAMTGTLGVNQNIAPHVDAAAGRQIKYPTGSHDDSFAYVLLLFGLAILAAMVGRWSAKLLNQPSVLGELMIGILVGSILYWMGSPLAFIVMHLDAAGEIFREVWQQTGSVQELLHQVFSVDEMAPVFFFLQGCRSIWHRY